VTDEGKEFLEAEPPSAVVAPSAPKPAQTRVPERTPGVPRALLSYSWDSEEHNKWVLDFAGRLQGESGIQILLDQWYLQAGDDRLHFMEQGVSTSDFVIVVCTATFAERANQRQGGVGYESMVITGELAQHILANKFIPVLRTGGWSTSLPAYLQSRLGVDLRGDPYSSAQYEQLLRVLHGEPIQPPGIGPKPVFDSKRSVASIPPPPSGAVAPASSGSGSVLGPANKRPNAIVNARYEKKGVNLPHESAFIRFWDRDGGQYSFENSRGEEHLGTKREVFDRFQRFQTDLIEAGYTRMQFGSNSDPLFSSL
jgi:TIR domain